MVYTKRMAKKSKKTLQKNLKKYTQKYLKNGKLAALIAALVVIIIAVVIMTRQRADEDTSQPSIFRNGELVTVEGTYVCLPHKDTTGPQTDECALGIRTDDNRYYGLQVLSDGYNELTGLKSGDRLEVKGTFQKRDSIYQSSGVIITDSLKPIAE